MFTIYCFIGSCTEVKLVPFLFQSVAQTSKMVKLPSDPRLVIAAIGESGEGKSTLLNLILNTPGENKIFFEVSEAPEACTLSPRAEDGFWRGDPNRPITVIDTPGLGAEEGPEKDLQQVHDVVKILKMFGHVDAFIIVLKSGQSRWDDSKTNTKL